MKAKSGKADISRNAFAVFNVPGGHIATATAYERVPDVLENILNGLDSLVYVSDMMTDEILFANKRLKDEFAHGEEVVGRLCWKVLQPPGCDRCAYCPKDVLVKGRHDPIAWAARNEVTGRYYKNVDSVIEWLDGQLVHLKDFDDITGLNEAQRETREAKERLQIALEASEAGVWEFDYSSSQFTYDNQCARFFDLHNPHTISIDALDAHLKNVMAHGVVPGLFNIMRGENVFVDGSALDTKLVFKNGGTRYVRSYGNAVNDEDGKLLRIVGMSMDITNDVNMEIALKDAKADMERQAKMALAASEAKSEFLSNMSHEIRTPMNAIIGMADLLANERLNKRQKAYVNDIRVSGNSLLRIINDILDFSKIEAGRLEITPVDYDLLELLENVGSMISFSAQKKDISFEMDVKKPLPLCLFGDDIRLRQILVNVLTNAVKFTSKGGVTLTVDIVDEMLCFDIADTGMGMDKEDIPKIFGEFNQLNASVNRNITGTGLGLSITKNLVSMMGGKIEVESERGKGTVFHIEVPLVPGKLEKLQKEKRGWRPVYAPDAIVLVVDDNEINLNVVEGLLRLCGIKCDTAPSGVQAIAMAEQKKYDIIFMDHMMPGMDGVETTRRLRQRFARDELVVVALTANAVEGVRETLMGAGMNDYLSKPIVKGELNRVLEKWLPIEKIHYGDTKEQPAKAELSPLLREVSGIGDIDVPLGLDRIGGLQDAYEKSLRILERRLPEVVERLKGYLAKEDLNAFAIEVHGLKGSLGNLGAMGLAKTAEKLELRSKGRDADYCKEHFPELSSELLRLKRRLAAALAKTEKPQTKRPVGNPKDLPEKLTAVRELADQFEGDAALEALKKLAACDYGKETDAALQNILRAVEEFEFEKAIELIDTVRRC